MPHEPARAHPQPADPAGPGTRFPEVAGRSLLGRTFHLPGDLPAERTLVVVAFRQWHQACVDRWIARAVAEGVPPTIRGAAGRLPRAVLELPVLATRWRPVRRFIDGGMATGIGDPDVLARTITLYTDTDAFRRALGIPTDAEVHAFIVTPAGGILARSAGEPGAGWGSVAAALGSDRVA